MPTVQEVLDLLERIAPSSAAFSWDKIGLQVGSAGQTVTRGLVSLDRSLAAVDYASKQGCQLLLTHHPLIFDPIEAVTDQTVLGKTIQQLIRHDISHIAAHTNWDAADGGINDALAARLGLTGTQPFGSSAFIEDLKLVVFVPSDSVDTVLDACAEAGAGTIGFYRRCAFTNPGTGTFFGDMGANPTVGSPGQVERVDEVRIEMICPSAKQRAVTRALLRTHPYEEPAFDFFQLARRPAMPCGRIGLAANPMPLKAFADFVDRALATKCQAWGDPETPVKKVAVVGGAADSDFRAAKAAGADVFVTGEVKQHIALEAGEIGIPMIAAGHYATEHPGCEQLKNRLTEEMAGVEWLLYEPGAGLHGRPL